MTYPFAGGCGSFAPTPVEPTTTASPSHDVPSTEATQTAQAELPPLPATPSALLGRSLSAPLPSLTGDLRAGPALDELVSRAVEGARREGSGRAVAWGVAVVLGAVLALRVIFDDVLPKLFLVLTGGVAVAVVVAIVSQAVLESRRQKTLLAVLEHLTRLAQSDATLRARIAPQVEAVVDALRAPSSVIPRVRKGS